MPHLQVLAGAVAGALELDPDERHDSLVVQRHDAGIKERSSSDGLAPGLGDRSVAYSVIRPQARIELQLEVFLDARVIVRRHVRQDDVALDRR